MMILEINNKQGEIDEDVATEAKRLVQFSLNRFEGVVSQVKVRFFDVNGPKGGIDKRCRISTKLSTTGQVIVSGKGGNYIEAFSNCLEKLIRSVRRKVEKRRHYPIQLRQRMDLVFVDQNETTT